MKERRKYKRYTLNVMDMQGNVPFARNVKLLNISLSGVLVETDRKPKLGNKYLLKLESEGKELLLNGIVIRSRLKKKQKDSLGNHIHTYTAGMHFVNLSKKEVIDTARFIKDHLVQDERGTVIYGLGIDFIDISAQDSKTYNKFIFSDRHKKTVQTT